MAHALRYCLILLAVLALWPPAYPAQAAPPDQPIPNGHFYTQANGQAGASDRGFAITDDDGIRFWAEFQRLGGVPALGYPASNRFTWDGFTVQVTQRVVMQWRPETGQVYFVNVFDRLSELGKDGWLEVVRSTPPPFDMAPDTGLTWEQVAARHWKWLDENEAIQQVYWADPDPVAHFGLPMSYQDYGNAFVIRAQRAVFQYWKEDTAWAKKGQVTIALGGDIAKEAGLFAPEAVAPVVWGANAERGVRFAYWVDHDPQALASLREHARHLDYVSPVYFKMKGDGTVEGKDLPEVSGLARSAGARLVPTVTNAVSGDAFSGVLAAGARRQQAIDGLEKLVLDHGYDGISLDFENLDPTDRDALSGFVADLAGRLHARGRVVAVAVVARTERAVTSWSAPYDYASLGRSADLVVLMAYGYRSSSSPTPGPTAPLTWVESTLIYAAEHVPPSRLLLGVAWYGYDWNTTAGGKATVLRHPETMALARQLGVSIEQATFSQSPYFRYSRDGQAHEVWFEDAASFRLRLDLARRYGLAGVSGWRMGQEDPEVWKVWEG